MAFSRVRVRAHPKEFVDFAVIAVTFDLYNDLGNRDLSK